MSSATLVLVSAAWDLAPFARGLGYQGGPFPWDEERRALLRAELDGIYAHLDGLSRDDFAGILDQVPIVKRKDEAAFGESRTKRFSLEAYDRFGRVRKASGARHNSLVAPGAGGVMPTGRPP